MQGPEEVWSSCLRLMGSRDMEGRVMRLLSKGEWSESTGIMYEWLLRRDSFEGARDMGMSLPVGGGEGMSIDPAPSWARS